MNLQNLTNSRFVPLIGLFFPLALWAMLWFSLGEVPGRIKGLANPTDPLTFLRGVKAILPFVAGFLAMMLILANLARRNVKGFLLVGPLGLTAVYGLVGLISVFLSPDGSVALYWTGAYLSVPVVLWAVAWGSDSVEHLRRLVNFTWIMLTMVALVLVATALIYMDLGSALLNPLDLLNCKPLSKLWFTQTDGILRSTGVGRYMALAGIIAMAGLWQGKLRALWGLILIAAVALLLSTGARTSIAGFAVAAPLIVLISGGRKAAIIGGATLILLAPVVYGTNAHERFLNGCIFTGWSKTPVQRSDPAQSALEVPFPTDQVKTLAEERARILAEIINFTNLGIHSGRDEVVRNLERRLELSHDEALDTYDRIRDQISFASTAPTEQGPSSTGQVQQDRTGQVSQDQTGTEGDQPAGSSAQAPSAAQIPTVSRAGIDQRGPSLTDPLAAQQPPSEQSSTTGPEGQQVPRSQPPLTAVPVPNEARPNESISAAEAETPEPVSAARTVDPVSQEDVQQPEKVAVESGKRGIVVPPSFFTFTGRTAVWEKGWELLKESPFLGRGFHADRLILGAHMHNSAMHSLVQTGFTGALPLFLAVVLGWILMFKVIRNISSLPAEHKRLVISAFGMLVFFSVRSIGESSGSFFGVDWLILGLILLYIQVVHYLRPWERISA